MTSKYDFVSTCGRENNRGCSFKYATSLPLWTPWGDRQNTPYDTRTVNLVPPNIYTLTHSRMARIQTPGRCPEKHTDTHRQSQPHTPTQTVRMQTQPPVEAINNSEGRWHEEYYMQVHIPAHTALLSLYTDRGPTATRTRKTLHTHTHTRTHTLPD